MKIILLEAFCLAYIWDVIAGFDRHLLGLLLIAKEEGLPIPELFEDPLFSRRYLGQWAVVYIIWFSLDVRRNAAPTSNLSFVPHSGGGGNFVLSTSLIGYMRIQGVVAPMVHNGYGFFYHIRDDR